MENSSPTEFHTLKRKDLHDDSEEESKSKENSTQFKKARHLWQIKGGKSDTISESTNNDIVHASVSGREELGCTASKSSHGVSQTDLYITADEDNTSVSYIPHADHRSVHSLGSDIDIFNSDTRVYSNDREENCDVLEVLSEQNYTHPVHIGNSFNLSSSSRLSVESDIFETSRISYSSSNENLDQQQSDEYLTNRLEKWQNKHVAKSIVDNAINKTLEEMGVSPEVDQEDFSVERSQIIEVQGISEAIRSQGLVPQVNHPMCQERLTPILSQLQQASDLLFGQTDLSHVPTPSTFLTRPAVEAENSSQEQMPQSNSNRNNGAIIQTVSDDSLVSNTDILDHAVSMAICSQGLTLQNHL